MEARVAWSRVADALRNARVEVLDHGLRLVPKGRRPPDGTPEAVPTPPLSLRPHPVAKGAREIAASFFQAMRLKAN